MGKISTLIWISLFFAALLLRLIGVDYGYFHGDERINDAAKVLAGQLVPGQHFYPPFINYLNAVGFGGLFGVGLGAGWWSSPGAFRAAYFADPTPFYITARVLTAMTSALMAPLFFGIARLLGLNHWRAALIGLTAVVMPLSVFMAHIAKGDTGVAVATIACVWAILARLETTRPRRWNLVIAICVALAMSFKQSALFVLAPLGICMVIALSGKEGFGRALGSFGLALGVALVLWAGLNIGLLLDLKGFIAFQQIQTAMSLSEDTTATDGLRTLLVNGLDFVRGLNPAVAIFSVMLPVLLLSRRCCLPHKTLLLGFWISLTVSAVFIAILTGPRQPEHLWITHFAGYLLLVGLVIADLSREGQFITRSVTAAITALAFLLMIAGSAKITLQAAALPVKAELSDYLASTHPKARILTGLQLQQPQNADALAWELSRLHWLADRYQTELPEIAPERYAQAERADALNYVRLPEVMFGLEDVVAGEETYEVQAHTWPFQPEEWQWAYWQDRIDLVVLYDFDTYADQSPPKMRQDFFKWTADSCTLLRSYEPRKPLFLERQVRVYDCTGVTP